MCRPSQFGGSASRLLERQNVRRVVLGESAPRRAVYEFRKTVSYSYRCACLHATDVFCPRRRCWRSWRRGRWRCVVGRRRGWHRTRTRDHAIIERRRRRPTCHVKCETRRHNRYRYRPLHQRRRGSYCARPRCWHCAEWPTDWLVRLGPWFARTASRQCDNTDPTTITPRTHFDGAVLVRSAPRSAWRTRGRPANVRTCQ